MLATATTAYNNKIKAGEIETAPQPTILVVDPENRLLDLIELNLLRKGYRVNRASDGQEALRCYKEQPPELILMESGFAKAYRF